MVKDIQQQNAERRLRHSVWEKPKCGFFSFWNIVVGVLLAVIGMVFVIIPLARIYG